jgi:hypothetical protein
MKVDPLDPDATMAGRQTQPLRHPGDVDAAGGGEPHQQLAAQPAATGDYPGRCEPFSAGSSRGQRGGGL